MRAKTGKISINSETVAQSTKESEDLQRMISELDNLEKTTRIDPLFSVAEKKLDEMEFDQ